MNSMRQLVKGGTIKETQSKIIKAWENLSEHYQKSVQISTHDVHYGPLAYGENRLNLLGDVRGTRVLEVGCGGGQNTIALARWGAEAYGVDPTEQQIAHARTLAKECHVDAVFTIASAVNLPFGKEYFDIVVTSYAFEYVEDIKKAFNEVYRVLKPNSIFVLCLGHPFFNAVIDYIVEDPEDSDIKSYLSWPETVSWNWNCNNRSIRMRAYYRTLSQVVNLLLEDFTLEKMVEQGIEDVAHMSDEEKTEIPYVCNWDENDYAVYKKLPCTLILKMRKPLSHVQNP